MFERSLARHRRPRHRHQGRTAARFLDRGGPGRLRPARRGHRRDDEAAGCPARRPRARRALRRHRRRRVGLRGRELPLRRVPRRAGHAAGRRLDHRPRLGDARRARGARAAGAGRGGAPRDGRRPRDRPVLRPDGAALPGRPGARRRAGLRQPRVPRRHARRARQHLAASPASRPRRPTPCSCSTACSTPTRCANAARHALHRLQRQGRGPAVARQAERQLTDESARALREARPAGRRLRQPSACGRRRGRRREVMPELAPRQDGVDAYYWTLREFCRERMLRFLFAETDDETSQISFVVSQVERYLERQMDAQSPDTGDIVLQAGTSPEIRVDSFGALVDFIDSYIERHRRARRPDAHAWAPSSGACCRRAQRRSATWSAARATEDAERHRFDWDARQVSVIDINNLQRPRASASSSASSCKRLMEDKEQQRRPATPLGLPRPRRAQQVRAARGPQPDQGGAARHRRARPQPRRRPDRRAADRQRDRAPRHRQRRRSASSAGSTRPRAERDEYGFLTPSARCAPADPQAGLDVPPAAGRAGAAPGRSSRSPAWATRARRGRRRLDGRASCSPTAFEELTHEVPAHQRLAHRPDLRGRSRDAEHEAALQRGPRRTPREQRSTPCSIAGDVFDTSAPSPESEALVYDFFRELHGAGIPAVVIAGNHDHPRRWDAIAPLLEHGRHPRRSAGPSTGRRR